MLIVDLKIANCEFNAAGLDEELMANHKIGTSMINKTVNKLEDLIKE